MVDYRSYPQTRLEPVGQRIKRAVGRLRGRGSPKRQKVYRVDLGDRSLKRVVFDDPSRASRVAECLRAFAGQRVYPELVAHEGLDLWVEFVEGETIRAIDGPLVSDLARIYATLYSRGARRQRLDEGPWRSELEQNLRSLRSAGVLSDALERTLLERTREWAPEFVWVGYDYGDARAANLLRLADGSHRFIDIESALRDQLLGTGVAKACLRWLGESRGELLAHASWRAAPEPQAERPALDAAFDFVELACLARWTRRSVALKKRSLVRPALFEALAAREVPTFENIGPPASDGAPVRP